LRLTVGADASAAALGPPDDAGPDRRDPELAALRRRAAAAIAAVASTVRWDEAASHVVEDLTDEVEIARLLERTQARLRDEIRVRSPASDALYQLHIAVSDLREDVAARLSRRHTAALLGVRDALARLRRAQSLAALLRYATEEVCTTCGFDRAIIWRVEGSVAIAESVSMPRHPEFALNVLKHARAHPPKLRHLMVETEMLRRGSAALILDAAENPRVYRPFADLVKTTSYVAAPIMPQGRVIGFLHADLGDSVRQPDELDRDVLRTFAEGFGYAVERTILLERLQAQRTHVAQLMSSTHDVMSMLSAVDVELVAAGEPVAAPVSIPAAESGAARNAEFGRILTRREVDVLELVATGASNARIAAHLVISEATVKCHVRSILRKLSCANRGEAISRYVGRAPASGS
jgi:DNA-binding CsgD family transcriptional regulator